MSSDVSQQKDYRFVIKEQLDTSWSEWFGGLTITQLGNGTTALSGLLTDQSALYGVLAKMRDLKLTLLSLTSLHSSPDSGKTFGEKINLAEKLALFSAPWSPQTVAYINEYSIMVVKAQGEFAWRKHDGADDFLLVLQGRLTVRQHERAIVLGPGELYVISCGIEHQALAEEDTQLLLIGPTSTQDIVHKATI